MTDMKLGPAGSHHHRGETWETQEMGNGNEKLGFGHLMDAMEHSTSTRKDLDKPAAEHKGGVPHVRHSQEVGWRMSMLQKNTCTQRNSGRAAGGHGHGPGHGVRALALAGRLTAVPNNLAGL